VTCCAKSRRVAAPTLLDRPRKTGYRSPVLLVLVFRLAAGIPVHGTTTTLRPQRTVRVWNIPALCQDSNLEYPIPVRASKISMKVTPCHVRTKSRQCVTAVSASCHPPPALKPGRTIAASKFTSPFCVVRRPRIRSQSECGPTSHCYHIALDHRTVGAGAHRADHPIDFFLVSLLSLQSCSRVGAV
jgi:hypothetical protein